MCDYPYNQQDHSVFKKQEVSYVVLGSLRPLQKLIKPIQSNPIQSNPIQTNPDSKSATVLWFVGLNVPHSDVFAR